MPTKLFFGIIFILGVFFLFGDFFVHEKPKRIVNKSRQKSSKPLRQIASLKRVSDIAKITPVLSSAPSAKALPKMAVEPQRPFLDIDLVGARSKLDPETLQWSSRFKKPATPELDLFVYYVQLAHEHNSKAETLALDSGHRFSEFGNEFLNQARNYLMYMDAGVDQHEKNFMYKFYRELDPNMEELNHWMIADFDRINHGYGAVFEEDFEELKGIWQLQPRYTDAEKKEDLENFDKAGEYQRKTMVIMRVPN